MLTLLKQHRGFFVVFGLASVLFLSDIWIYKEFVRAESYFALGARLMIEQGDWITPHAPDELPLNKPPLTYWLIAVSYKIFGTNYGSARIPSVLAALIVLAIVYSLGRRLSGQRAALIAIAMLASSYLFLSFARMAMSDMLLTLFVTASLACFVSVLTGEAGSTVLVLAGYATLALGVLAKGPLAIVLVATPLGLELLLRRKRDLLRDLRILPGAILFLVITAPYFLFVYARSGAAPLRFFFFGENLQRFTGQIYGASGRPFWNEMVSFFSDFLPWSLLIFSAIWFHWRRRGESRSLRLRPLFLWLATTLVLFSISSFKLDYYLLPAMPAAALIIAPVLANAEHLPRWMRRILELFLALFALGIIGAAALSLKAAALLGTTSALRFLPLVAALLGTGALLIFLARRRLFFAALVLAGTIGGTILTMQLILLPAFVRFLPATQLAANVPVGSTVYTSSQASDWANCLAFNLAAPRRVERLSGDNDNSRLLFALQRDPKSVAVVRDSEYANLLAQDPLLRIVAQADTFGHGGLSLKLVRDPRRERLVLIGHSVSLKVISTAALTR
jgi:4-amino-4-deoxy-L-arabinose transferase-like glycosyltransferase